MPGFSGRGGEEEQQRGGGRQQMPILELSTTLLLPQELSISSTACVPKPSLQQQIKRGIWNHVPENRHGSFHLGSKAKSPRCRQHTAGSRGRPGAAATQPSRSSAAAQQPAGAAGPAAARRTEVASGRWRRQKRTQESCSGTAAAPLGKRPGPLPARQRALRG